MIIIIIIIVIHQFMWGAFGLYLENKNFPNNIKNVHFSIYTSNIKKNFADNAIPIKS